MNGLMEKGKSYEKQPHTLYAINNISAKNPLNNEVPVHTIHPFCRMYSGL